MRKIQQHLRFFTYPRLAFTTAATVGYGDLVPSTHSSRAFAVVVMLGLAVLSLVTASVAAVFVGNEERDIERELMQEIRALRADVAALQRHQHSAKD
jgi:voltage-gated potassium channel